MKRVDLTPIKHQTKIGEQCPYIEPNITEDCIFYADGNPIGFFMRQMPDKLCKIADLANKEFNSKNVPKSQMNRSDAVKKFMEGGKEEMKKGVSQYSTIIGATPPRPHMKRPYPSMSSVHQVESASTFIKAMLLLAKESEKMLTRMMPEQYKKQSELF